jgi:hypothetical protein
LDDARAQTPALEQWRKKLVEVTNELKKAINQRKPLAESTKKMIEGLEAEAEQWVETGKISNAQQNRMWKGFKPVITLVRRLNDVLEETGKIEGITPETYKKSVEILKEHVTQRQKNLEAQKKELEKADEVTAEIGEGVETEKGFPSAAAASTAAIATKTEQQRLLNEQLAKGKEIEASQGAAPTGVPGAAPGAPAPTTIPTAAPTQRIDTASDAASALEKKVHEINTEVEKTGTLINGVVVPFGEVGEAAGLIQNNFAAATDAAKSMSEELPVIIEGALEADKQFLQLKDSAEQTNEATEDIGESVGVVNNMLEVGVVVAGNMAGAMDQAASSARAAASACAAASKSCSGGSVTASQGGRYFASGGRGTDTVPAWLTPGEFVINKRSARQFFPQLQAMNAGQKPIFREQGGHVTSIGDIHVSMQSSGGGNLQDIREIATGLRRELRRKTIKLH